MVVKLTGQKENDISSDLIESKICFFHTSKFSHLSKGWYALVLCSKDCLQLHFSAFTASPVSNSEVALNNICATLKPVRTSTFAASSRGMCPYYIA